MLKKLLLPLMCVALIWPMRAQTVQGSITDAETGEPLPMVNILASHGKGTVSDNTGYYSLKLHAGTNTIQFSFLGYQQQTHTVTFYKDTILVLDISLVPSQEVLQTVVVSAGKFAQRAEETTISLEVIKPDLIKEKNTVRLEEAFNQTPGVIITDKQANIRSGSGWSFGTGSRVLMLVDDMPLLSPDAGQIQWLLLPNEAVMQMEVIKAASSVLYGTSAMNGLINVRTITPKTEPLTEVNVFGGFWDAPKRKSLKWWEGTQNLGGFTFLHARKVKSADITLSGMFSRDANYRWQEEESLNRINLKTQFYPSSVKGLTWGINGSILYSETGDALLWMSYEDAYIPRDSSATRSTGWDYYIDPFVIYRHGKNKHVLRGRYMGINNNARSEATNYENYNTYYYGEYQYQHFFNNTFWVTAGATGALGYSNSEIFTGYHETENAAIFAQVDKKFSKLTLSGGVRYEAFRLDDRNFSKPVFRAGANYALGQATFLRASIGQGFRFPSMAEAFTFTYVGSTGVFPNTSLQPEVGWTSEIGIKQGFKIGDDWKGFVDLSGFVNYFDNMIEFTFGVWENYGFGFRSMNVGATRIIGSELSVSGQGKIGPLDMRILAGYTYALPQALEPQKIYAEYPGFVATYESTSSNPTNDILKYRYRHLLRFDWTLKYGDVGIGTSIRHNDYMQNIDAIFEYTVFPGVKESREALINGDLIIDARLFYQITPSWRVSIIIDNLNNREYSPRPAQLGAPRRFTFTVFYQI